jgi:sulfofructose kinase
MKPILTLGAIAYTSIFKVSSWPLGSAKILPEAAVQLGDGMAASAAASIVALGGEAAWWGRVGDDLNGRAAVASLAAAGVDMSATHWLPNTRASFSSVLIDERGERIVVPMHPPELPDCLDAFDWSAVKHHAAALTEVRWPAGAARLLSEARQAGIPGVLDAEVAAPGVLAQLCGLASHILFSETGLAAYAGEATPEALHTAQQQSPHAFVGASFGERGFYWLESGKLHHCPALPVKAVDTLGAGDVFHGAYTLALAEGQSPADCARFANTAASLKCAVFGGRLGAPSRAAVALYK